MEVEGALELLQASGFELDLGGEGTNSGTGGCLRQAVVPSA